MKKTNSKKDEKPKKVADVSAKKGDDPQLPPMNLINPNDNLKKP